MELTKLDEYPSSSLPGNTLFEFNQNAVSTFVYICLKQIHFNRRNIKGVSNMHTVHLKLCDYDVLNSFEALSAVSSVLKVVINNKLAKGQNKFGMRLASRTDKYVYLKRYTRPDNFLEYELCCYDILKNTVMNERKQILNIGQIYHFNNALTRAMNWSSPFPFLCEYGY